MIKKELKLCFVTATRAEYGLIKNLLSEVNKNSNFKLQLVVTGSHLSKRHGLTIKEIENDGFFIDKKIDIKLDSDTNISTCNSLSILISNISHAFEELKPDLIFLLGDRYELMGAAMSAVIFKIPIAHIHGGEITEGSFDERIRHSITKLSDIHFVASEVYRNRVIQLGEHPKFVFNVGGLGVEAIKKINFLRKEILEKDLKLKFKEKNLLITYHPITVGTESESICELSELLKALSHFKDTLQIFTMPNSDPGNKTFFKMINKYTDNNENAISFSSLGQLRYLSCLKQVDAVVGNSSSGLLEAPSLNVPTVNIGNRQKGRLMAKSIINSDPVSKSIIKAIDQVYKNEFKKQILKNKNPYEGSETIKKIISILEKIKLKQFSIKEFCDL